MNADMFLVKREKFRIETDFLQNIINPINERDHSFFIPISFQIFKVIFKSMLGLVRPYYTMGH